MASLIGTKPNQVPTNGDLGTLAFQDHTSAYIIGLKVDRLTVTQNIQVPVGTDAERPTTPVNGMIRYSTTSNKFEGYTSAGWSSISGLDNFIESRSIAAPNATIPAHSIAAAGSEANIDAVVSPKGSGALLTSIPDGLATGGNKRGTNAVDLQQIRFSASQVASGVQAVVSGGYQNTASETNCVVSGGFKNIASGNSSVVSGGTDNTASASYSAIIGGSLNTASGVYSIAAGKSNIISGSYSVAIGGAYGRDNGISGAWVFGGASSAGDAHSQQITQITEAHTSDATPTALLADYLSLISASQILVPMDSRVITFSSLISARANTSGDVKGWKIEGVMKRGTGAASVAFVGTPVTTLLGADAGASAWTVVASADTTYGGLKFTATGAAATNITWSATTTCSYAG